MRISRTSEAIILRLLCVLAVLLMLSGCGSSNETVDPVLEKESISFETTPSEQKTEMPEDPVQTEPAEVQIVPEEADEIAEIVRTEAVELENETLSGETAEETVPEEIRLAEELLAAQEENQTIQKALEELTEQQEKTRKTVIILSVAAAVILLAALVLLYFWRRAVAALKKARKRNQRPDPDTPITQIHVGKAHGIGGRGSQQDSFSVSPVEFYGQNGVLAVVADGMGGLENGDKASQAAVISAMENFYQVSGTGMERLLQLLTVAQNAVNAAKAELNTTEGGTTLLMGLIQNGEFHYVSIGDSRIYLYRSGRLVQLNREHSYLYDQLQHAVNGRISMQEALLNEKNACITSYLGMQDISHIDIPATSIPILPKDKFLLMSDGVYNALTQEEICLAMRHPAQDAAEAIQSFIATKNFQDQDNYTLVILECR